ncbi:MAG: hypothetical protein EOM66_12025 [Clostridia bacterium]|nr:hypothetical protein [Clostridia bacterium]
MGRRSGGAACQENAAGCHAQAHNYGYLSKERVDMKKVISIFLAVVMGLSLIVASGLADEAEVQVAYAIGEAKPLSVGIDTFGTNKIDENDILAIINKHFDLRPKAIIEKLDLRRPIYKQVAAYGHFGRDDIKDLPWEQLDMVEVLKQYLPKDVR